MTSATRSGRRWRVGACALACMLGTMAGCGSPDNKEITPVAYPHQAQHIVLSIQPGQIMNQIDTDISRAASYWIYGNRRAFVVDPSYRQETVTVYTDVLSREEMTDVMQIVAAMGLADPVKPSFGTPTNPLREHGKILTLTLSLDAGGVSRHWTITFPNYSPEGNGINRAQTNRRFALAELQARLRTQVTTDDPGSRYRPDERVWIVREVQQLPDDATVRDWPGPPIADNAEPWAGTALEGSRCLPVGDAAGQVRSTIHKFVTNKKYLISDLVWRSGGTIYEVRDHPLLPDTTGCATAHEYVPQAIG